MRPIPDCSSEVQDSALQCTCSPNTRPRYDVPSHSRTQSGIHCASAFSNQPPTGLSLLAGRMAQTMKGRCPGPFACI